MVLQHKERVAGEEARPPVHQTAKGLVTMARNANRNSQSATRNARRTAPATRPVKLSQRGVLVVSILVGGLVVAAANGYAGPAALAAYVLYLLLTGGVAKALTRLPNATLVFRALCWTAVAGALLMVLQGSTAPGGPAFGLALAAALAVALKLTGSRQGRRRNTH